MRIVIFGSFLFGLFCQGYSQNSDFLRLDSIMGNYTEFSVDNFGRVYLCKNDVLSLHYQQNDTIYTASLKSFRPKSLESTKSFRTFVFDPDRSLVHFYDNTLTDIHGEINLVNVGIQQPILVCESFAGNNFWVLDGGLMRFVKLNQDLAIVSQTENLVTLFDSSEEPSQMLEQNDFVFILIPGKGVAIFDVFGTFIKIYATQAKRIGVLNNYLLLLYDDRVDAIANDGFRLPTFSYNVPKDVRRFVFSNSKVYFLMDDKLLIGAYNKVKN